jgi:transposase
MGGQRDLELTMRRYALRDDQWDRIKDLLPGREGHVGVTAKDNRLFVEAVLYRYRAGIPWRDLPADNEYAMIDSTIVRAHQHSAGARKKGVKIKPSGARAEG